MISALLAPLLALAAPQTASLETRAFEAFDTYCATLDSTDALIARIRAAGWQPFEPDPASPLARMLTHHNKNGGPGWKMENWAFVQGGDPSLVLIVTRAGSAEPRSVECRVAAPQATRAPSADRIARWSGNKQPGQQVEQPGINAWLWEPGLKPSHGDTGVLFVEPGSPVSKQLPLSGLMISAQR